MGSGEEKLTVSAESKGFEEAAKKIDKVSGAEEKLVEKTEGSAKVKDKAEASQQKLNAAESDYIGILTQVHPALGQLVDGMLKGGKVAGDFATANCATARTSGNEPDKVSVPWQRCPDDIARTIRRTG